MSWFEYSVFGIVLSFFATGALCNLIAIAQWLEDRRGPSTMTIECDPREAFDRLPPGELREWRSSPVAPPPGADDPTRVAEWPPEWPPPAKNA